MLLSRSVAHATLRAARDPAIPIRRLGSSMNAPKRILLVDDDAHLRHSLAEQLQLHEEFETIEAGNAAQALAAVRAAHFDAVLLDAGLPDMDGREACRLLRREGVRSPILMLTTAEAGTGIVSGADSGANDSIVKPFRLGALLARLRTQLSQHARSADTVFPVGPYSFRPADKLLVEEAANRRIRLTEKETAILTFLYRAGEAVVSRDVLLDEVWGYNARVTTHTLETHVYRLRQKIERDPARAEILVTEPGGYRLVP